MLPKQVCGQETNFSPAQVGEGLGSFYKRGGPILGSLYEGSYDLGSILGAPDFWKLPLAPQRGLRKSAQKEGLWGLV